MGLKITAESNLKVVNFLDVTLDLRDNSYRPYRKPNDDPIYVHTSSNHPPHIIKQIPAAISKRISPLSHNEESFNTAANTYNDALNSSGYTNNLEYSATQPPKRKKNRKRKIIWFNHPILQVRKDKHWKIFPTPT